MKTFKCPNCSGEMEFDAESQKLVCSFCNTRFDPADFSIAFEDSESLKTEENNKNCFQDKFNWDIKNQESFSIDELTGLRSYSCKSCGGEIITDDITGTTTCPYCGSKVILMNQFEGFLKPDLIIPFKRTKEEAMSYLKGYLSAEEGLPFDFVKNCHIETIQGIYVPFWLFSADVDASVNFEGTHERVFNTSEFQVKETEYYGIYRAGHVRYENIPVDGSVKINDKLMSEIEPFDTTESVPFNPSYFAGFCANKYDVDLEHSIPIANRRIKSSVEESFTNSVIGFDSLRTKSNFVQISSSSTQYALFPVWYLVTKWKNEKYIFLINGQTGKISGTLPATRSNEWKRKVFTFLASSGVAALISTLVIYFNEFR